MQSLPIHTSLDPYVKEILLLENKDDDDASGNSFNIGTTVVTYIVIDESGNRDSCSFNVVITDNATLDIKRKELGIKRKQANKQTVTK